MILAVLNQKGGSAKTTLAFNLARTYQRRGLRVLIADADPQASALEWSEAYEGAEEMPETVQVDEDPAAFARDVRDAAAGFDLVVVDGAPRMNALNRAAVAAADVVVIPVQPSALDVRAVAPLVAMIEAQREKTPGRPRAVFVVVRQVPGTNLAAEAAGALEAYGLPVLRARTSQRVAYPEAAALGVSVLDYDPAGRAAQEIQAIADELWPR